MTTPVLCAKLTDYAARYETADFLVGDPSWFMHQVSGCENQEAMAFLASALSYGSRKQFLPKIRLFLDWSGGEVSRWVADGAYREFFGLNDSCCFYRLYDRHTMRLFLDAYRELLLSHGSMGDYLRLMGVHEGLAAVELICSWFAEHGSTGVVPKDASSSCKRVCMFLRWMVRDGSPVDLGLWGDFIDKRTLIMPLDTHVLTEACGMGLLHSRSASMSAALRLTAVMAEIFPGDPLRGDFALFGVGALPSVPLT
ncbi:MAG: DUF2400 domain-containing protein [Bacteroidales bacterium]|nr:DUF2400 domain-containing protein [Bacteroidales bacterium]